MFPESFEYVDASVKARGEDHDSPIGTVLTAVHPRESRSKLGVGDYRTFRRIGHDYRECRELPTIGPFVDPGRCGVPQGPFG
jgi:hypothetical protein